ncbi:contactin-3-like [Cherax quadricarinatus]
MQVKKARRKFIIPKPYRRIIREGKLGTAGTDLVIHHLTPEDTDSYTCSIARHRVTHTLQVLEAESVVEEPSPYIMVVYDPPTMRAYVVEGETTTLSCEANGHPAPTVLWRRQNEEQVLSEGPTLHLVNIRREDAGYYFCSASNGVLDPQERAFYLQVKYVWVEAEVSKVVVASEERRALLTCQIKGHPKPKVSHPRLKPPLGRLVTLILELLFDPSNLSNQSLSLELLFDPSNLSNQSLSLESVLDPSNLSNQSLSLESVFDPSNLSNQSLSLESMFDPSNLSNQSLSLESVFDPSNLSNQSLSLESVLDPSNLSNQSLSLESVFDPSNLMVVLTDEAVELQGTSLQTLFLSFAETLDGSCTLIYVTQNHTSFGVNRWSLASEVPLSYPHSQLENMTPSALGDYKCRAHNEAGEDSATITVEATPGPVQVLEASPTSTYGLYNITWEVESLAPVDYYFVSYNQEGSSEVERRTVSATPQINRSGTHYTESTLVDLTPGITYHLTVRAVAKGHLPGLPMEENFFFTASDPASAHEMSDGTWNLLKSALTVISRLPKVVRDMQ